MATTQRRVDGGERHRGKVEGSQGDRVVHRLIIVIRSAECNCKATQICADLRRFALAQTLL